MDNNLHNRQLGLIDPAKLQMPIAIIGAGSIGSWTTLALTKLGCPNITVYDGDFAEEHNAGSQIYKAADEGMLKVQALAQRLQFLTEYPIQHVAKHWEGEELGGFPIVIAAVDNITTRTNLFKHIKGKNVLYIDARMAGNALEIYTLKGTDEEGIKRYEKSLFAEGEEIPVPCSERSVVYNVFVCAGLIADLVAKVGNEEELPYELVMDLYNLTLYK